MRTILAAAVVAAGFLVLAPPSWAAERGQFVFIAECFSEEIAPSVLQGILRQTERAVGVTSSGKRLSWTVAEDGMWSLVMEMPDRNAVCRILDGDGFEAVEPGPMPLPKPGSDS